MNIDFVRSFFVVVKAGSLNRAAEQLHISQSTLTRQIQTLENELGGKVFERSTAGVALTAAGQFLLENMRPVVASFDSIAATAREIAAGRSGTVRVGYLLSATTEFLNPVLATMRRARPDANVALFDLTPAEQIEALRNGKIDIGLIGPSGALLSREFYTRRLTAYPVFVGMAEEHPLAKNDSLRLKDLRNEEILSASEELVPGYDGWITKHCRRAGFRPRFRRGTSSLTEGLSRLVSERVVTIQPQYLTKTAVPGVVFRPLRDDKMQWDMFLVWQRGKVSQIVKLLIDLLADKGAQISHDMP
ncbi:MAG TPA: LysR family transcriptional regulator [Candidatus Binatia bacterium]|nr:LysR family transcriptional regulator [Candidatus Binatia bacterium]